MSAIIHGHALVLGDDVNTDEIHPSCFYSLDDDRVRAGFLEAVPGRDARREFDDPIVIAGNNFGCGSSRETGARVFLLKGVRAIVARSFARIFFRNVINLGLPALTCPSLSHDVAEGETVVLNLDAAEATIDDDVLPLAPLDPLHKGILAAGGLAPYLGLGR